MWLVKLILQSLISRRRNNASMLIATIGLAVGVMSLVSVVGIMNGLQKILIDDLIAIDAYDYKSVISNPLSFQEIEQHSQKVTQTEGISLGVPFVDEFALVRVENRSNLLQVRAIDGLQAQNDDVFMSAIQNNLFFEQTTPMPFVTSGNIVLGWVFALQNGIQIGDVISLTLPGEGIGFTPIQMNLVVSSLFETSSQYDTNWGFISLSDYLEQVPNKKISNVTVGFRLDKTKNTKQQQKALTEIQKSYPETRSWQADNQSFYVALKTEKITLAFLSAVIFAIIVLHFRFAILRRINSKLDDVISLRTLGASPKQVRLWFLGESMLVGIIGIGLGLVCGLVFVFWNQEITAGFLSFFGTSANPISGLNEGVISLGEVSFIVLFAFALIFLTVWTCTKKISQIVPMQVIRYD